jgi:hypothetical protein
MTRAHLKVSTTLALVGICSLPRAIEARWPSVRTGASAR